MLRILKFLVQNNFCYDIISSEVNVFLGVCYMWIILVWVISTLCYLPMYFAGVGYIVPNTLIQMKYLFVVIPLFISLVCVKKEGRHIKKWFCNMLMQKAEIEAFALCSVIALCGISCTRILGKEAWNLETILFNTLYLFLMATLEEIAWRGYRLDSLLKKTSKLAILVVSFEWAIWHIPMWMIRNSLRGNEIPFWLVYTLCVGVILGKCMTWYKNILVPIILHTIFNICFLIPIEKNVIIVACVLLGMLVYNKLKRIRSDV